VAALVGPLQTFVSTVQRHCRSLKHANRHTSIPPTLVLKRHTLDI
jgi:hypothetical protein